MKNIAVWGMLSVLVVLTGCCNERCAQKRKVETTPVKSEAVVVEQPVVANVAVPCSYSCMPNNPCVNAPEPMVLKPRVVETVTNNRRRRPCCDDQPIGGEVKTYVPDAPEIYVISANRTVNSMLKEAEALYKQAGTMRIYVDKADLKSRDLPGGIEQGTSTLKKRFSNISNVLVMEDRNQADYVVTSAADWYDTATKTVPAIKYDIFLKAKDGHLIGEWSEIIHQAQGDRSWW